MSELKRIHDLLEMDMGSCIDWLIENQYNFSLAPIDQSVKLKDSVFENMDALEGNAPEFLSNDSLEILHDMNDQTDFLLELYQVESVKYINEWKKLNLKKEHKSV